MTQAHDNKLKATPGPWVMEDNDGYGPTSIWAQMAPSGSGTPGRMIAEVYGDDCETEANAHLLAASWEMYQALQLLHDISGEATIPLTDSHAVRRMARFIEAREKASAALKKAEGHE